MASEPRRTKVTDYAAFDPPGAPSAGFNWSALTELKGGARRGDVMLLLRDCVGLADGRRLRVGTGTASEEEGVVRKQGHTRAHSLHRLHCRPATGYSEATRA